MIEQQYSSATELDLDGLPRRFDVSHSSTTVTSPCSSGFPDYLPYTNSSTFPLAGHCDCMLSPISTAASPPLQHIVKQYATAPDVPLLQQPSPPNSAKMYQNQWCASFDMGAEEMPVGTDYYLSAGRGTPGPPDPYLGHFAVSESGPIAMLNHGVGSPYFMDMAQMAHHDTLMMRSSPSMSVDSGARDVEPSLPTPTLSSNGQTDSQDEKTRSPFENQLTNSAASSPTSPPPAPKRVPSQSISEPKKKAPALSKKPSSARLATAAEEDVAEHTNCNGEEVPPQISEDCPDEERFLFESRWKNRHNKGQMWETILREYTKKFKRTEGKEALQMKYKRGRSRYLDWLPEDEKILREVWEKMEKDRYKKILAMFHEKGGSRNMFLSASDIEYKVAAGMGLEEELYLNGFQDLGVRRRCRHWKHKRHGVTLEGLGVQPCFDDEMVLDQIHEPQNVGSTDEVVRTSAPCQVGEVHDVPMEDDPPVRKTAPAASSVVKPRKQKKTSDKPRKSLPSKPTRR